jgi:hypothetical protein
MKRRIGAGFKKRGDRTPISKMPPNAVLLFEDETVLLLFPVLRRTWALCGEQGEVAISGRNAKRVLFGTINPCAGHRILMRARKITSLVKKRGD